MIGSYKERTKLCREMARIAGQIHGVVGAYIEGPFHDEKSDIDMGVIYDEEVISKVEAQSKVHQLLRGWAITYLDGLRRKPKSLKKKVAGVLTLPSMTRDAIVERTKILQELANWLREEADALEEGISKPE